VSVNTLAKTVIVEFASGKSNGCLRSAIQPGAAILGQTNRFTLARAGSNKGDEGAADLARSTKQIQR